MSWHKLDDKFHRNPKVLAMSDAAHRIYTDGLSYCADTPEPTGYFAQAEAIAFVKSRGKSAKVIEELVRLNAWERVGGGYLVHDFDLGVPDRSKDRVRKFRDAKLASNGTCNDDVTTPTTVTERYEDVTSPAPTRTARRDPVPVPVPEPESLSSTATSSSPAAADNEPGASSPRNGWPDGVDRTQVANILDWLGSLNDGRGLNGIETLSQRNIALAFVQSPIPLETIKAKAMLEVERYHRKHPGVPIRSLNFFAEMLSTLEGEYHKSQPPVLVNGQLPERPHAAIGAASDPVERDPDE